MLPAHVTIYERQTNRPVEAVLHGNLDTLQVVDIEIDWAPERLRDIRRMVVDGTAQSRVPQHAHWNWALKAISQDTPRYRTLGIEVEGRTQGLMMVAVSGYAARLMPDTGQPLVYVDYLETAPWNSRAFADQPRFSGVGRSLMQTAVRLSRELGHNGRIGLHSLDQARNFYTGPCNMNELGPDPEYHNLVYYELSAVRSVHMAND